MEKIIQLFLAACIFTAVLYVLGAGLEAVKRALGIVPKEDDADDPPTDKDA